MNSRVRATGSSGPTVTAASMPHLRAISVRKGTVSQPMTRLPASMCSCAVSCPTTPSPTTAYVSPNLRSARRSAFSAVPISIPYDPST